MDYVSAYYPAGYRPDQHDVVLGAGSTYLQHKANAELWGPIITKYHRDVSIAHAHHHATPQDKSRLLLAAVDHQMLQSQYDPANSARAFLQWEEETQRFYRVNHDHPLVKQGLVQMVELLIGMSETKTQQQQQQRDAQQLYEAQQQQQQQQQRNYQLNALAQQQQQQQQQQTTTEETWQPYMYHETAATTATAAAANDTTLMHPSPIRTTGRAAASSAANPQQASPTLHATIQAAVERQQQVEAAAAAQKKNAPHHKKLPTSSKKKAAAAATVTHPGGAAMLAASITNGLEQPQTQQAANKKKRGRPRKSPPKETNTNDDNNNNTHHGANAVAVAAALAQVSTATPRHVGGARGGGQQREEEDEDTQQQEGEAVPANHKPKAVLLEECRPPPEDLGDGLPWPEGWVRERYQRQSGNSRGTSDRYWLSPGGKKFRSMVQVRVFLELLTLKDGNEEQAFRAFKEEHKGGASMLSSSKKVHKQKLPNKATATTPASPPHKTTHAPLGTPTTPVQLALQKTLSSKFPTSEAVRREIVRLERVVQQRNLNSAYHEQAQEADVHLPILNQLLEIYRHGNSSNSSGGEEEQHNDNTNHQHEEVEEHPPPPPPPRMTYEQLQTLKAEFSNRDEVQQEIARLDDLVNQTVEEDDVEQWEDAMEAGQRLPKLRQLYEEWDKRAPRRKGTSGTDRSKAVWNAMFAQLEAYHRRHGNTRVIYNKRVGDEGFDAEEKKFANWVANQRYMLNRRRREEGDSMPDVFKERIERLDSIHFDWPSEEKVMAGKKAYEKYRAKKGNSVDNSNDNDKAPPDTKKKAPPPAAEKQPTSPQLPPVRAPVLRQPSQPVAGQPPQPVLGQPTVPAHVPPPPAMYGHAYGMYAQPPGMQAGYGSWYMMPPSGMPGSSHMMDAQQQMAHRQGLPNPHPPYAVKDHDDEDEEDDESSSVEEEEAEGEDKLQTLGDEFRDRAELDAEIARVEEVIAQGRLSEDTDVIENGVEAEAMLPLLKQLCTWDKFDAPVSKQSPAESKENEEHLEREEAADEEDNNYVVDYDDDDIDEDLVNHYDNREEVEEEIERLESIVDEAIVTDNDPKLLEEGEEAEEMLPRLKALLELDKFATKPAAKKKPSEPVRTSVRVKMEDPGEEGDETFDEASEEGEDDDEEEDDMDLDDDYVRIRRATKRPRRVKRESNV